MSSVEHALALKRFMDLFRGYPNAYGTGIGGWVHEPPTPKVFEAHVAGRGPGMGIGPLMPDGNCYFGAIDLDRPDFKLAKDLMALLPGTSWLERSRSGNAHVLVFFSEPIEAWVVRGILRETLAAVGEKNVEVFPKSDFLYPGMVGNYLNLPYFGDTRPVINCCFELEGGSKNFDRSPNSPIEFDVFTFSATKMLNDPTDWRKRANWLSIPSPAERETHRQAEFGTSSHLHRCASYIIEHREDNPVIEGHRAAVFFALSKMLANWSEIDQDEALSMLALVNDASPDPIPVQELSRIYANAERGAFTSTGCDDPLVIDYADPECPIVKGA